MLNKYADKSDEELVILAKNGDEDSEEFLIRKYKAAIKGKANLYYIVGADKEDLMQEGMIGIFKAIKSYQNSKQASFYTFANLCINRQIITAIKTAGRLKHLPLNTSISLNNPIEGEHTDKTIGELIQSDSNSDPEAMLLLKETLQVIEGKNQEILSDLEVRVMDEYMHGKSYLEISEIIEKTPKAVDNAVQRIRKKLAIYLAL
jgi:RNA polymerase sporulation-specific sigma factor